jgi:hypothetical protein
VNPLRGQRRVLAQWVTGVVERKSQSVSYCTDLKEPDPCPPALRVPARGSNIPNFVL